MVAEPGAKVVTSPVAEPIAATVVFPLDHEPPDILLESVTLPPVHISVCPAMADGKPSTVTFTRLLQADPIAYDIVAVPAAIPVYTPDAESIVAIAGLLLCQYPPLTELVKVMLLPVHKLVLPVMPAGRGLTTKEHVLLVVK
jgi:hypothetical protein